VRKFARLVTGYRRQNQQARHNATVLARMSDATAQKSS
jgi:hypothetical protein